MTKPIENKYLTPQEHAIIGSTVKNKYKNKFYVPIEVQDGTSIEEVDKIRREFGKFQTYSHFIVDGNGKRIDTNPDLTDLVLAPLNLTTGETEFDPRPIDENLSISEQEHYKFRKNN